MSWPILSDSADLAVESTRLAQMLGLAVAPRFEPSWVEAAHQALCEGPVALALVDAAPLDTLVALAHHAADRGHGLVVLALGSERRAHLEALSDLGVATVQQLRPMLAVIALRQAGARAPWAASAKALSSADRARLKPGLGQGHGDAGELVSLDDGLIGWRASGRTDAVRLGEPADVGRALWSLRQRTAPSTRLVSKVEGVDPQAVLDVIYGPRRALSDPASKAALLPYGLPMPLEELCGSASRAAAEAARIGFPVRLTLTSPDLRTWDHPDLSLDMVGSAAAVRDAYRSLVMLAEARSPEARLLGVTVTATSQARALLRAHMTPLTEGAVAVRLGFADAHGLAADDSTCLVLPGPLDRVERALKRLAGRTLILRGTPAQRRRQVEAIGDVLLRAAAFLVDHTEQIEAVELRPLALLVDDSAEVRQACVSVSDAFERDLATRVVPAKRAGA